MPWGKQDGRLVGDHQAHDGQVSESSDELTTIQSGPDQMTYRGYIPQRYIPPGMGPQKDNAGEVGDGTVPNNTDRGNYGHGVEVDSEVWAKDHSRRDVSNDVPQVMPEAEDQREYDPIKVTVVDRSPDEIIRYNVGTYFIGSPAVTVQGNPVQTGLTPIRVLGHDPRRTRALIAVSNMQGGSIPVILTQENSSPAYGFPIASATTFPLELHTSEEVWVSGSTATDQFTVSVISERAVNADAYRHD